MIDQYKCAGCGKRYEYNLVEDGAHYYHKDCLQRLLDGLDKTDNKAMFKKLSEAFNARLVFRG